MIDLIHDSSGDKASDDIVEYIKDKLDARKKVLFLVPGGSSMRVAVSIVEKLENSDVANLFITLTDERYGRPGHDDENWSQLSKLGMSLGDIDYYRVLRGEGPDQTASDFSDKLELLIDKYDYKIGLFGIGADGHTAGIKPYSVAVNSEKFAEYYPANDFERITMTPKAIRKLDRAFIFAQGEAKKDTLWQIANESVDVDKQPAQVFKELPKVGIYSDIITDLWD